MVAEQATLIREERQDTNNAKKQLTDSIFEVGSQPPHLKAENVTSNYIITLL
jgi:hypothetical protein